MAWQSMAGMGGGSNGGGNGAVGGDGAQQVAQPQGTEYTLQGTNTLTQ
jgi:striatin 1/3/4